MSKISNPVPSDQSVITIERRDTIATIRLGDSEFDRVPALIAAFSEIGVYLDVRRGEDVRIAFKFDDVLYSVESKADANA